MHNISSVFPQHVRYILIVGISIISLFIWVNETVCQIKDPLSNKAIPEETAKKMVRDKGTPPAVSLPPAGTGQMIMPQAPDRSKTTIQNQTTSGDSNFLPPSLPSVRGKTPLAPGSISSDQGPAFPGQKAVSPRQGVSLPGAPMQDGPIMRIPVSSSAPRGMVTLNFDDADVFTIIQTIFGNVLKVNYVVDSRIKGRVTFRAIAPVPIENVLPLMEVIFRLNGIGVVEESGLYRLVPISDISREPSSINYGRNPEKIQVKGKALLQVVPINYVQSSDVLKLITPFASSNASLIDVPKGNQIIIVDTDANIKRMLKLVEIFDNEQLKKTKPQVFVYPVQNGKAKDIAGILQQTFMGGRSTTAGSVSAGTSAVTSGSQLPTGASGTSPASSSAPSSALSTGTNTLVSDFTKFIPDEVTNSIIILSTPGEYVLIKEAIDKIDIIPRQVIIEGLIAQVTLTDNLSVGLSAWIRGSIGNINIGGGVGGANLTSNITTPARTGLTLYGIDNIGNLQVLIASMATDSKAKLLATPHILVSDNREAKIQIGQQVPLVTSETYGSTTVAPQRTIQYRDIGIILKVKPRVNEGGLVNLELYQEVSTYDTIPLYAGETQIILNKNDASTSVAVQDGQTIIIGGLIREDTTKAKSGIPFLSKIPFLGWLFGSWIDNKERTEIIILLTPHVVKSAQDAGDVTNRYIDNMVDESKGRIIKKDLIKEKTKE